MLKDELDLDGRPNLNLASFVGTYMEREAEALMVENLAKNMSDADEYPAMMAMQYVVLISCYHCLVKPRIPFPGPVQTQGPLTILQSRVWPYADSTS